MRDHTEMLYEKGFAFPGLYEEFRDRIDTPTCAITFQLPYHLDLEFCEYIFRGNRSDISIHFSFISSFAEIDQHARRRVYRVKDFSKEAGSANYLRKYTQCIALMPIWGARLKYYDKYIELSKRGFESNVLIPREKKPFTYSLSGAITVRMYELELSKEP